MDGSADCVFCRMQNNPTQEILGKTSQIYLLKDLNMASSTYHVLAITHAHIHSVNSLDESHLSLIGEMEKEILAFLSKNFPGKEYRLGFHVPPYISVPHLHMHGFALPFTNCFTNYVKYGFFLLRNDALRAILKKRKPQGRKLVSDDEARKGLESQSNA